MLEVNWCDEHATAGGVGSWNMQRLQPGWAAELLQQGKHVWNELLCLVRWHSSVSVTGANKRERKEEETHQVQQGVGVRRGTARTRRCRNERGAACWGHHGEKRETLRLVCLPCLYGEGALLMLCSTLPVWMISMTQAGADNWLLGKEDKHSL